MKAGPLGDQAYFIHIQEAIGRVEEYTSGGKEAFFKDRKTQDAVVRNIEIIGEAVKNVSNPLKVAHPDVPWRLIAGMRNKIIHEYFGVDLNLVWEVVEKELPQFRAKIEAILKDLSGKS